jgi:excinuclease ABC subunit B
MTVPQLNGMYFGDRSRKQTLIDYGFRLPSALDNRPLRFEEFEKKLGDAIFISATPGPYETKMGNIAEQLVRPTGLLDPKIEIRPLKNQLQDALKEMEKAKKSGERVLLLTLSKRSAEDIALYLKEKGVRAEYLHSDIKTLERTKTLYALRSGDYDALVGINLLREGLDLPEVALILILDADKEGYLRNYTSLIQTIGRASRHINGRAILYADEMTGSIKKTVWETGRRRKIQEQYNEKNRIKPEAIIKPLFKPFWLEPVKTEDAFEKMLKELQKKIKTPREIKERLEQMMLEAADNLDFKKAAKLKDLMKMI